MIEPLPIGRSIIKEGKNQLFISIPIRKIWPRIIFFTSWFLLWSFGTLAMTMAYFKNIHDSFLPLVFFMIVELIVFLMLVWNFFGREVIILDNQQISIRKKLLFLNFTKDFLLKSIHSLTYKRDSLFENFITSSTPTHFGFNSGPISFSTGKKVVRFGNGVDESEALFISNKLMKRLPR